MKTIPRNTSSLLTSLFVIGGLAAFYLYRRNGGEIKPLLARGADFLTTAREKINEVAPDVTQAVGGVTSRSRAHEISTSPEDMDRFPAT
jgi:hypothetical protein